MSTDFHEEVARELEASYAELAGDRARVAALEELERLSLELAAELRRPLTVFDVIRAAPTPASGPDGWNLCGSHGGPRDERRSDAIQIATGAMLS